MSEESDTTRAVNVVLELEAEITTLKNQLKEAQREAWEAARVRVLREDITRQSLSDDGTISYQQKRTTSSVKYQTFEDYLASKEKS